jgi:hypothetical protein
LRPPASPPVQPSYPPQQPSDADADTAARLQSELRERLTGLRGESRRIASSIARHGDEDQRRQDADIASRQRDLVDRKNAELTAARASFDERLRSAASAVTDAATLLAPGAAGEPWSDSMPGVPPRPATHVRFGVTQSGAPAVAPFLEHAGWALRGEESAVVDLIRQVALRTTAQIPLRFLRIRVYDPRIEGALGWLSELRDANPASYPPPAHSTDDLRAAIADVTGLASAAAEQINARHVRTLGELWLDEGRPTHPYTLVVLFAYPLGVDEAAQAALIRLAESGPPRGISLLVHVDETVRPERDVRPDDLLRHLTPFAATGDTWRSPLLPDEVVVTADPPPARDIVKAVLTRAVREVSSDSGPTIPLSDLLAAFAEDPWRDSVTDGIEAVIGLRGRDPVTLALRSENPPHPNLLIGGAVGQGKSNLLLTIIYALAARYAPEELEMLLLDFKQGLEFKRFDKDDDGRNWLPHARILSLESSMPFGLAVLEFVLREMERRAQVFNAAHCNGFREYRSSGQPMARMLLIIDEFQVLFDGTNDVTREAVQLFERLARQGRAFGIHILLSSQTLSGISGLQVKGDSIFAQFPLRVSLKNTADESQAILSRGNTAAAELTYRGEVVVNRNYGQAVSNEIAIAGYADPVWIGGLQKSLWERASSPREPWVFLGNDFAQWPRELPAADVPTARIGRPIAVTDDIVGIPFANDVDQTVAIIGSGDSEATAVLAAAVDTATMNWGPGSRIVLLDGRQTGSGPDQTVRAVLDRARSRGIDVTLVSGGDVPGFLIGQMGTRLRDGGVPTLVIALQLQRIAGMGEEVPVPTVAEDVDAAADDLSSDDDEFAFVGDFGEMTSGAAVLRDIAVQGGTSDLHLIGWWTSLRALVANLEYDHKGVSRYVFARAGLEDVREVAGALVEPVEGSPRVQVYDRSSADGLLVVVPFEPLENVG